jgi:hypothetical protein
VPAERHRYVARVIEMYRQMPGTLGYIRRADRRLAAKLHDRGVSLQTVEDAILLATARRTLRPADAPPLDPIASLHYLLPIIHELEVAPPEHGYLNYLRHRLAHQTQGPADNPQIP